MSIREQILQDVVAAIKSNGLVNIPTVTREPADLNKLARTAFPCVQVESSNEVRNDITQGNTTRLAQLEIFMNVWITGSNQDTRRNEIVEYLEQIMDEDRTRGGLALDTELTRVEYRELGESAPYASMRLVWNIDYIYTRGNP